jgi:hypothetical protein
MLRTRVIRPGIATNVELAKLGPEATILFERLWMMADREGRLIDDPARIRVEAVPAFEWSVEAVEKLLKSLWKSGFIERYKAPGSPSNHRWIRVLSVVNFKKHQWIHKGEPPSLLPSNPSSDGKQKTKHRPSPGNYRTAPGNYRDRVVRSPESPDLFLSFLDTVSKTENVSVPTEDARAKTSPVTPAEPERKKPPATATSATAPERPRRPAKPVDFYPYTPADVDTVRQSLKSLARVALLRLPQPDDGIIRAVLDACRGASGEEIHDAIHGLLVRERFREVRSWGLLPHVLKPLFSARAS